MQALHSDPHRHLGRCKRLASFAPTASPRGRRSPLRRGLPEPISVAIVPT